MFDPLLIIALVVFLIGLGYRIATWFTRRIGPTGADIGPAKRLAAAATGSIRTLFSSKIGDLFKALLFDVGLQLRVFKEDRWRWLAHMLLFYGFTLLLLMHALQSLITAKLFSDYYSTVNPFFFLRDFFGTMVLAGIALVVVRRYIVRPSRLRTHSRDHIAIAIVAAILLSGFMLEGLKITSHSEFERMVEDYAGLDDEDEIAALLAFWISEEGLVAAHGAEALQAADLDAGREVHELNCADCHAPARHAFAGYTVARLIRPMAVWLDQAGAVNILWHLHFIACFIGLAYLPFSKLFHMVATPISLILNRVMDPQMAAAANVMTRQMIELDACTHCGSCSLNCSAAMYHAAIGNENILPSEKMAALKKLIAGKKITAGPRRSLLEGVYLCTNCDRCTVRCPSGIRLKDLWENIREELLRGSTPPAAILSPFSFTRGLRKAEKVDTEAYVKPLDQAFSLAGVAAPPEPEWSEPIVLTADSAPPPSPKTDVSSFRHCFSCQSCTTVCPVVANFEKPNEALGLLPHQIMCCLGLGLDNMAAGARMIWDCLTCYQCQENCPQQVEVCDLLFVLKNRSVQKGGYFK